MGVSLLFVIDALFQLDRVRGIDQVFLNQAYPPLRCDRLLGL
jgi:hypothetical protein